MLEGVYTLEKRHLRVHRFLRASDRHKEQSTDLLWSEQAKCAGRPNIYEGAGEERG